METDKGNETALAQFRATVGGAEEKLRDEKVRGRFERAMATATRALRNRRLQSRFTPPPCKAAMRELMSAFADASAFSEVGEGSKDYLYARRLQLQYLRGDIDGLIDLNESEIKRIAETVNPSTGKPNGKVG